MSNPIVWMDNVSQADDATSAFYAGVFGWQRSPAGAGTMLLDGESPFAGIFDTAHGAPAGVNGWVPYFQVADLAEAQAQATGLGGEVVDGPKQGPAGIYCLIKDPGGAYCALWTKG